MDESPQPTSVAIQQLSSLLNENLREIRISRVPQNTKKFFVELANKEFEGDYGMTLKWLIDMYVSEVAQHEAMFTTLQEHETRIKALETTAPEPTIAPPVQRYKEEKMCDGSIRRIKVNSEE